MGRPLFSPSKALARDYLRWKRATKAYYFWPACSVCLALGFAVGWIVGRA